MRFRTRGTFETETLIALSERIVSRLQDADVTHISGVNVYLSIVDKRGMHHDLLLNGTTVEQLEIVTDDLALPAPPAELSLAPTALSTTRKRPRRPRRTS